MNVLSLNNIYTVYSIPNCYRCKWTSDKRKWDFEFDTVMELKSFVFAVNEARKGAFCSDILEFAVTDLLRYLVLIPLILQYFFL